MTHLARTLVPIAIACMALAACAKTPSGDAPAKAAETPAKAAESTAKAAPITLKTVQDAAYGYAVDVPEGASLRKTTFRHIWAWTYKDGVSSYQVLISEEPPVADLKAAQILVSKMRPGAAIKAARAVPGGFLIKLSEDPSLHTQEIWVWGQGGGKTLQAIFVGKVGDTLDRMSASFKLTP